MANAAAPITITPAALYDGINYKPKPGTRYALAEAAEDRPTVVLTMRPAIFATVRKYDAAKNTLKALYGVASTPDVLVSVSKALRLKKAEAAGIDTPDALAAAYEAAIFAGYKAIEDALRPYRVLAGLADPGDGPVSDEDAEALTSAVDAEVEAVRIKLYALCEICDGLTAEDADRLWETGEFDDVIVNRAFDDFFTMRKRASLGPKSE